VSDEEVQVLMSLGLNFSQARIYMALLRNRRSTAKAISNASNIAREHVYVTLRTLENLGIVEETVSVPTYFTAVPIQGWVSRLVESRIKATLESQEKVAEIVLKLAKETQKETVQEESSQFILIPNAENTKRRVGEATMKSRKSIDVLTTPWIARQSKVAFGTYVKTLEKKHVTRKTLICENSEEPSPETLQFLSENAKGTIPQEIRWVPKCKGIVMAIFDGKVVILETSAPKDLSYAHSLWSNNLFLLEMAKEYFELIWETAKVMKPAGRQAK